MRTGGLLEGERWEADWALVALWSGIGYQAAYEIRQGAGSG